MKLDTQRLRELVDEKLPRAEIRAIQSSYKDADRFDKYLMVLQERVPWDDQIVLPFGEHLFIVAKGSDRYVAKCDCGHEFCDYRENWKRSALINVRATLEELQEIYPEKMHGHPDYNSLREYFCPGCLTLLDVEAVPPGYPAIHDFVPDLEGFYEHWLGRKLP